MDIVHRDIKPENILFEDENEEVIKLIDFGLARRHKRGEPPMNECAGTAYYACPEMLNKGGYDNSCDIWSVGIIAYMLVCGYPRSPSSVVEALREGVVGDLEMPYQQWSSRSDGARDFIRCLLCRDPVERLTAKEALGHPWIIVNIGNRTIQRRKVQPAVRYLRIP